MYIQGLNVSYLIRGICRDEVMLESVALSNSFCSLWQLRCVCMKPRCQEVQGMCDCETHMPVTNPVIRQLLKQILYETKPVT